MFSDEKTALTLPSENAYYKTDPSEKMDAFTLILSATAIPELSRASKTMTIKAWDALESDLTEKSRIIANSNSLPFPLAGNLGAEQDSASDALSEGSLFHDATPPSF